MSKLADRISLALSVSQAVISRDRQNLYDCHRSPITGTVDDDLGKQALAEYDVALELIGKAIADLKASSTTRISPEMLRAMQLIREGLTPYAAAKLTGIHQSTISRSRLYRQWKASKAE